MVAFCSTTDPNHHRAAEIVGDLNQGTHGEPFVTDYIVAETLNYFVVKARDPHKPEQVARDLLGEDREPWLAMARLDDASWRAARVRFRALSRAGLSFTDCTSAAFAERNNLEAIVSFDRGFDGIFPRIA